MKTFKLIFLLLSIHLFAFGNSHSDSIPTYTSNIYIGDYMPKVYNYALIEFAQLDGDSVTMTAYTVRFSSGGAIKNVKKNIKNFKLKAEKRKNDAIYVKGSQLLYFTDAAYKNKKNRATSEKFCEYISSDFLDITNEEKIQILEKLLRRYGND